MFDTFRGVSEAAMISSRGDDIPNEGETQSQSRRRRAVGTRRLFPLAASAPVSVANVSRERSRQLLQKAFNNGMCHFR